MSSDQPVHNESGLKARQELVTLCQAMLAGETSFFEGAMLVRQLRFKMGVPDNDSDFTAFVAIESETDHLPLKQYQHLWSTEALKRLQYEFERTEAWAKPFGTEACENLIKRFAEQ